MPSGPPELHRKWCQAGPWQGHGDSNALHYLEQQGFKPTRGGMFIIPGMHVISEEESSALDYLWMEWDYAVERTPPLRENTSSPEPRRCNCKHCREQRRKKAAGTF